MKKKTIVNAGVLSGIVSIALFHVVHHERYCKYRTDPEKRHCDICRHRHACQKLHHKTPQYETSDETSVKRDEKTYRQMMDIVQPFLVRKYGEDETRRILERMEPIYRQFLKETPFIGGKENFLSVNLDMAIPFFALYEATGRTLTESDIDELLDLTVVTRARKVGKFVNMNRLERSWLLKPLYAFMETVASEVNAKRGNAWNNTWGIALNPDNHDHGFAITLIGCPLADFARSHGYLDILPCLCRGDVRIAEAMHGRLIRHHTVAEGAESCDYWYVGDKNTEDW